jgi:hypothetical protein
MAGKLSDLATGFRPELLCPGLVYHMLGGQDSVVTVATHYRLDDQEIESLRGVRYSTPIQTSTGALPAYYTRGTGSLSWGKAAATWGNPPAPIQYQG